MKLEEALIAKQPGLSIDLMDDKEKNVDGYYAKYVLFVMVFVYVLNFIDRQVFSILAQDIKADLNLSDSDLGFLAGTSFIVFYTIFGIPLARLADVWNRKKLISIGLSFWSLMTFLSGTARAFLPLSLCRFGIAVGEASASPAIYSLLYDYFSPKVRTTVLAIYGSGLYIGIGLGLLLGGVVLDAWKTAWPNPDLAPFGLRGWQAVFMMVGLPGILMALWVFTLREPIRGQSEGIIVKYNPHPFREFATVLLSMLPITNVIMLLKLEVKRCTVVIHGTVTLFIASFAASLAYLTGDIVQWVAVGLGVYMAFSWGQSLSIREPEIFRMIFRCKTLLYISFGGGITLFMTVAIGFWKIPYLQRAYNVNTADLGLVLGVGSVLMGFVGVILGGVLADRLRAYSNRGKLYVLLVATLGGTLTALVFLITDSLTVAYVAVYAMYFLGAMGYGPSVSTVNDLVTPRARATASAFYYLVTSFIGGALGPYCIGFLSDAIMMTGIGEAEALRQSMLWCLLTPLAGLILVTLALKHIKNDEKRLKAFPI